MWVYKYVLYLYVGHEKVMRLMIIIVKHDDYCDSARREDRNGERNKNVVVVVVAVEVAQAKRVVCGLCVCVR